MICRDIWFEYDPVRISLRHIGITAIFLCRTLNVDRTLTVFDLFKGQNDEEWPFVVISSIVFVYNWDGEAIIVDYLLLDSRKYKYVLIISKMK